MGIRTLAFVATAFLFATAAFAQTGILTYTARVTDGAAYTDAALIALAQDEGAAEVVVAPGQRYLLDAGTPGIGYAGFSSFTPDFFSGAKAAQDGAVLVGSEIPGIPDGAPVRLTQSIEKATGRTVHEITAAGHLVYRETRWNSASGAVLRVEYPGGETILQIAAGDVSATGPYKIMGTTSAGKAGTAAGGAKAAQPATLRFTAPRAGLIDLGWDSGFVPSGSPVQVRIGATAAYVTEGLVNGSASFESSVLRLGSANGSWGFDFGAEVIAKAKIDLPKVAGIDLGNFEFNLPYVPNFDLRATDTDTFSNYLLDSSSNVSDSTPRTTLYSLDITGLILGGLDLPSWLSWVLDTVNAGAAADVSIEANGDMTATQIACSDGTIFTSEGQSQAVMPGPAGYQTSASYQEAANLAIGLKIYPTIFVQIIGQRLDLPILELPWTPIDGPVDLAFSTSSLSFEPEPQPEGEGAAEGSAEGVVEGTPEGIIEGTLEGALEGTPEGIAEGSAEGSVEGMVEGLSEGSIEGSIEGQTEGVLEGMLEGMAEGFGEGEGGSEGLAEGYLEGEGACDGPCDSEGEGEGVAPVYHSSDFAPRDYAIQLNELLRLIQYFNSGGVQCSEVNPDGYAPGIGNTNCPQHSADTTRDWRISLQELLRVVQFFNLGGYWDCDAATIDGFCPGRLE